jgi:hypothetical protein
MNNAANVMLSESELELLCQTDWILTKQRIIEKIYTLFGRCATQMQTAMPTDVLQAIGQTTPKIARGEQYQQLPWVMLDYPRLFTPHNTAAIRCFCWWGNFVSITLQLAGPAMAAAVPLVQQNFIALQAKGYYVGVGADAWQHHFQQSNYLPLLALSAARFNEIITQKPFLKIATKIPLQEWDKTAFFLMDNFGLLSTFLPKHPAGATNLLPGTPKAGSDL